MLSNTSTQRSPSAQRKVKEFLFCVLCVLCVELSSSTAMAVIIDKIAAIVNDDVITQSEVEEMIQLDIKISGLPKRDSMLQQRIDHHLVLQQIKSQPPVLISNEEIQDAYESFALRHGNEEQLGEFLGKIGIDEDDLIKEIRDQLTARKFIRDRFRPFVSITIEDAEDYYEKVYKPAAEMLAKTPPPLAEIFGEIQNQLVESRVQDQLLEWLDKLRKSSTINIKE
jgi:peptidyl-prolyl cis-trans isomerase SurA